VDLNRVEPGDPDNSLLINKLTNVTPICGGSMPPTGLLDDASIARIRTWIEDGADDN
jgi:hypothetical protein